MGKIALIDKKKPTKCRSEQKIGLTGVKWRLWKGRPTKHSTAQNVRIKHIMAWNSLMPHRRDLKIERNKIHKRNKDSTAWEPTARTGAIVTAERNRNTTKWATETREGQSTSRSTPWIDYGGLAFMIHLNIIPLLWSNITSVCLWLSSDVMYLSDPY